MSLTYFTARVTFLISAEEEPAEIIEQLQYALNTACSQLEGELKHHDIGYRLGDTFSEIVLEKEEKSR